MWTNYSTFARRYLILFIIEHINLEPTKNLTTAASVQMHDEFSVFCDPTQSIPADVNKNLINKNASTTSNNLIEKKSEERDKEVSQIYRYYII